MTKKVFSRKFVRFGLLLIGLTAALVLTTHIVAGYSWRETYIDYVGTSDAYAESAARNAIEWQSRYACDFDSYMSPSVVINVIGWTWTACTNKCSDGRIVSQATTGGFYQTSSGVGATNYVLKTNGSVPCNGSGLYYIVIAEANHDFNDTNAAQKPWRPYTRHNYYP